MKKLLIITTVLLAVVGSLHAQQTMTYNQYGSMITPLNTAGSLLDSAGSVGLLGRRQWVGIEGAPQAFWMSGHIPVKGFAANAGLNARHESLAVEQSSEVSAFVAKSVRLSSNDYLSVSLSAGFSYYRGNFSSMDPNDPAFGRNDIRETDALAGFGLMLYRRKKYYIGVSLPRLSLSDLGSGGTNRQYRFYNQYHIMAGYQLPLASDFELRPAVLVTYSRNEKTRADVSAMVFAKQLFGLGVNVRTYGHVAGMAQVNVKQLGIGYSYQFHPNRQPLTRQINNAAHEIGLSYRFGNADLQ